MVPLAVLAVLGCRKVEEAPPDLDSLMQDLWLGYEADDDAAVRGTLAGLDAVLGGASLVDPVDGSLADLTGNGPSTVGMDVDTAPAAGMYIAGPVGCVLSDLEAILVAQHQDELYTDVYDSYDRQYLTDADAWPSGEATVGWTVDIAASVLGSSYTERIQGGLRYVPEGDGVGPAILARTWLLEPAEFEEGSNSSFDQDWQIEAYWPRAGGDVMHVYGLWRQMSFSGFTTDSDGTVRIILNNLHDWDDRTTEICADGSVPAR